MVVVNNFETRVLYWYVYYKVVEELRYGWFFVVWGLGFVVILFVIVVLEFEYRGLGGWRIGDWGDE